MCLRPYPVPRLHEAMFRKDTKKLVKVGVIEEANGPEWVAPSFDQPKPKTNHVRFLSDFRNLNRQLKLKPYPMPKICKMILNLEGFQYATSLELNVGYYHIRLRNQASNLCTIILPWGNYKYKHLPIARCNSPDIFQDKMNKCFCGFKFIRAYTNDLLIITKGDWYYHLKKLEQVLKISKKTGLSVISRSHSLDKRRWDI